MSTGNKEKNERYEKAKDTFSHFLKKTSDISKKAAEGAKEIAEQTKKNIYDAQAKKYLPITVSTLKSESFRMPNIINIVDNAANRKFITDEDSIGWIEQHEDIDILYLYEDFVGDSGLVFVPIVQRDGVYCKDNFEHRKFIDANLFFRKATDEKLAELSNIAYCLGAKNCSVEIVECEAETSSRSLQGNAKGFFGASVSKTVSKNNTQSGKRISYFEGHDDPQHPSLKWFAHDENIKGLIEMRCNKAIKSTILELKGSASATMSRNLACTLDRVMNVKGKLSMESNAVKDYDKILVFEIEF